jgi:hypothetical protein
MKLAKIVLVALTLGCLCTLGAPITPSAPSPIGVVVPSAQNGDPILAANLFKWLDELINGARKVPYNGRGNLPQGAYQYTQREDRRGGEHGWLYYLALGIWRLAAGAGAAAIAGKAIEKQDASTQTKNIVVLAPFVIGLFMPLFALFGAGIIWLACKEGKTDPPAQD